MDRGARTVAGVFLGMVVLWLTRRPVGPLGWPGWSSLQIGTLSLAWFNDSAVAMLGAVLMFIIPVDLGRRRFVLDVKNGLDIPWDTLLLFGGGLALGKGIANTGVAHWFADQLGPVATLGSSTLILAITILASMLIEVTSNTATVTMLMPVMHAMGQSLGGKSQLLMSTAAVATSMAFMSPIGTPPNAIVYGTGRVSMGQMAKAGFALNILAAVVWWLIAMVSSAMASG